jgi:hypothetical protein
LTYDRHFPPALPDAAVDIVDIVDIVAISVQNKKEIRKRRQLKDRRKQVQVHPPPQEYRIHLMLDMTKVQQAVMDFEAVMRVRAKRLAQAEGRPGTTWTTTRGRLLKKRPILVFLFISFFSPAGLSVRPSPLSPANLRQRRRTPSSDEKQYFSSFFPSLPLKDENEAGEDPH